MQNDDEAMARRRWVAEQAIANCKIEGLEPSKEFLERNEKIIRGEMTSDQAIEEIKAKVKERQARNGNARQ